MKTLFFATSNQNKAKELSALTAPMELKIVTLADYPNYTSPEENGSTFLENALIKSRSASAYTGLPALADDSGLTVDALNGAPGIYSARYSGKNATSQENNRKLLAAMADIPREKRQAQFRALLALTFPDGREYTTEGTVEGYILKELRGSEGFGYDPLFYLPQFQRTMAELTMAEKNSVSHRGKAFENMLNILKNLI